MKPSRKPDKSDRDHGIHRPRRTLNFQLSLATPVGAVEQLMFIAWLMLARVRIFASPSAHHLPTAEPFRGALQFGADVGVEIELNLV